MWLDQSDAILGSSLSLLSALWTQYFKLALVKDDIWFYTDSNGIYWLIGSFFKLIKVYGQMLFLSSILTHLTYLTFGTV